MREGMLFGFGNRRAEPAPAVVAEAVAARVEGNAPSPDKTAGMAGNKRDRERVPLEGQVRGEVMVFQPMTILDISIAGAQIETEFALQLESLHDFRLSLGDRSVVVKGRVAHCHIGELTDVAAYYRTGIEFADLSDHARSAIGDFMLAMKYAKSSPTIVDGEIVGPDRTSRD
jgi:hypothetical protein